jgi:hypothetical protein
VNLPAPIQVSLTFDDILRQADVLSQSRIIPAAYRNRPPDIVAAGLAGTAFGWDVMTSLRNYHVIEGTASLRPEAMLALVRRAGHSVKIDYKDTAGNRACVATGRRADNGDEHTSTFSDEDAQRAGLAGKKNWQQYQDAMLTWRAVSQLCRVLFPDVVLGAGYTPDEIGGPLIEVPDETDPLASPLVPANLAKTELLEACDNDRALAKSIWGDRGSNPVTTEDLQNMIDQALSEDIQDAEIVSSGTGGLRQQSEPSDSNLDAIDGLLGQLADRFDAKVLDAD